MRSLLVLVICASVCCFLFVRVDARPLENAVAAPITSAELIATLNIRHSKRRGQHNVLKRRKLRREVKIQLGNMLESMINNASEGVPLRPGK